VVILLYNAFSHLALHPNGITWIHLHLRRSSVNSCTTAYNQFDTRLLDEVDYNGYMAAKKHYNLWDILTITPKSGFFFQKLHFFPTEQWYSKNLQLTHVRKDTEIGPCKNIRRTIPSGLFEQRVQKSVNKQKNNRLSGDHPSGVNICQRASRKSLTIKNQTNERRVPRCANMFDFNCAGFWMREDRKNIGLKDDSYVGPRLSCSSRGVAF